MPGNSTLPLPISRCGRGFNEAPASTPGKSIPDDEAAGMPLLGFNEAPASMPGKSRRDLGCFRHRYPCFNEAPASMPGKSHRHQLRAAHGRGASIRPRQVCRGIQTINANQNPVISTLQLGPGKYAGEFVGAMTASRAAAPLQLGPGKYAGEFVARTSVARCK